MKMLEEDKIAYNERSDRLAFLKEKIKWKQDLIWHMAPLGRRIKKYVLHFKI